MTDAHMAMRSRWSMRPSLLTSSTLRGRMSITGSIASRTSSACFTRTPLYLQVQGDAET